LNTHRSLPSAARRHARPHRLAVAAAVTICCTVPGAAGTLPADTLSSAPPDQLAGYEAHVPKTILELQPFRQATTVAVEGPEGRAGTATLMQINPAINAWMLLTLDRGGRAETYHLENPDPEHQQVQLDASWPRGLLLSGGNGPSRCDLWSDAPRTQLDEARQRELPYVPLCDGRILLRNRVAGYRTRLEEITDLLRDQVPGGEQIVGFVRESVYRDAFLQKGAFVTPATCESPPGEAPLRAAVAEPYAGAAVVPENLGIAIASATPGMVAGCWYAASGLPGVYLSAIEPQAVSNEIFDSHRATVSRLDSVESSALAYLVAFDLGQFDLGFEIGTDHPRLDWSDRTQSAVRDNRLPGPDGVGKAAPLVTTGMVSPAVAGHTVAVFTGGFKRSHSAFRYGEFASRNHGSHYGFLSNGTIFSKLHPGLATIYVLDDGTVDLKTWSTEDDRLLGRIRHARQNGVPVIQYDERTGTSLPGGLVARWGPGNWSGSAEGKLRSLRAGACIQETPQARFLVYGYFSSATPSAMTRVFQAYGCRDAMLLDMNALEHTYLALYTRDDGKIAVQHLIDGMTEVDQQVGSELVPRFIGFPDNRDFFYLVRRTP
jgi:hypothetical protein